MKFVCNKQGNTLRPTGSVGEDALRSIHDGDFVMVEVKQGRNLAHHQKFFALLDLVRRNQSKYQTTEDLLTAVKIYTGHYDIVQLHDGKPVIAPKSISFARMDQQEFGQFYDKVIRLVCEHIIPGLPEGTLRAELEAFAA